MSEYLNPPYSSSQHHHLIEKKGNASTRREQNGYPIAKINKKMKSSSHSTDFLEVTLKKVSVRAHNVHY